MAPARQTSGESVFSEVSPHQAILDLVDKTDELRRDQQRQYKKLIKDTKEELGKLLKTQEANKKKQRKEATKEQAKHITTILENMERRREIELEVQKIIADVQGHTAEVEQMMMVGYDGRLEAMHKALKAGQAKRHAGQGAK